MYEIKANWVYLMRSRRDINDDEVEELWKGGDDADSIQAAWTVSS